MKAKLADLGAARFTDASLSVGPVSPSYIAPERLSGLIPHKNKESDVYSMGITLCELFTGDQKNQEDRPRLLGSVDHMDLRLLCSKMVCENAEKRVSASAALAINDRVFNKDEYTSCHPRRMVRGVMDGVQKVTLCDKPW
jgi:serine/threonine protein kinase